MKVNISGVGLIPKVGLLAPVYGKDLQKDTVAVILNYASFKVYVAATGVQITKKNIDEIFGVSVKQATKPTTSVAPKKKKTTKEATTVAKKDVKVEPVPEPSEFEAQFTPYLTEPEKIEQVEEPVVLDEVVEAPAIEEPVEAVATDAEITSSFVEDVESVKEQLDEAPVVEEEKTYTSKKKKKR